MFTKLDTKNTLNRPRDGRHCDLCGCSFPAVRCDKCSSQIFCLSCDDMYHRHPKRRFHLRKAVDPTPTPQARPVLPVKVSNLPIAPGDPSKMPLPPPRKKKPAKSFFDNFRRVSPASDTMSSSPRKEYSWTDKLGNIKKFMSNRPLPPVPPEDDTVEDMNTESSPSIKHDLSFIHKRVEEKPPSLPERSQPRMQVQSPFLGQGGEGHGVENNISGHSLQTSPPHELGNEVHRNGLGMTNGNSFARGHNFPHDESPQNRKNHQMHHPSFPNQSEVQGFGTIRRQSHPEEFTNHSQFTSPTEKSFGMHSSSSATDLHALSMMAASQGMPPYPQYPFNPHLLPQYPYPMYPQYPQYFGKSWANLSNLPPTSDGDFSDQSESSSGPYFAKRHHHVKEKKAKRSHSVLVDRMPFPGQFYPYGPYPPGYPPQPWMTGQPMETPPSPASSMRSLSRLGRSHGRRRKGTRDEEDDDFSSSPISRPKSSSSEMSKNQRRNRRPSCPSLSSSDNDEDVGQDIPRHSPGGDQRHSKQNITRRKSSSSQRSPISPEPTADRRRRNEDQSKKSDATQNTSKEVKGEGHLKDNRENSNVEHIISNGHQKQGAKEEAQGLASDRWQCRHCTYLNNTDERICQVCCKTADTGEESKGDTTAEQTENIPKTAAPAEKSLSEKESMYSEKQQSEKHEMAILSTALDEAEKEINRGLEELLKLKEESLNDIAESNALPVYSSPQNSSSKQDTPPKTVSKAEQQQKTFKNSSTQDSSEGQKSFMSKADQILHAVSKASSQGVISKEKTPSSNPSVAEHIPDLTHVDPREQESAVSSLRTETVRVSNPVSTLPPSTSVSESGTLKDSFCQTYQDVVIPEGCQERRDSAPLSAAQQVNINGMYSYPAGHLESMQSPMSYNVFNPLMADRGYPAGYNMLHRAHSRASLFGGRLSDATPSPADYGNMGLGYGPMSMHRSLSRSSLLGDSDGWQSEYLGRQKPDFYLSMEELVERRRQETMRAQGLELVRMIREAEQQGFTADDIQVAINNCGKQNPVTWLQANWKNMIKTVVTLSTNYGRDKKENDVGVVSESEAIDALRLHKGNIWAAVTECVEGRQRKFLELSARGNFTFNEIVDALTSSEGSVESAYANLTKTTLKPFLMRIWGSGEGAPNLESPQSLESHIPQTSDDEKFVSYAKTDTNDLEYSDDESWEQEEEDFEDDAGEIGFEYAEDRKEDFEDEEPLGNEEGQRPESAEDDDAEGNSIFVTDQLTTPISDKSDYCDAFGSGLGERYLSSSSIDEIYLFGADEDADEENFDSSSDIIEEEPRKKGASFLGKLAAMRKGGTAKPKSSKVDNIDTNDSIQFPNVEKLEHEISKDYPGKITQKSRSESQIVPEASSDSHKTFQPSSILKQTFDAIKDTVSGNTEKAFKSASPNLTEMRTIVVHDKLVNNALESKGAEVHPSEQAVPDNLNFSPLELKNKDHSPSELNSIYNTSSHSTPESQKLSAIPKAYEEPPLHSPAQNKDHSPSELNTFHNTSSRSTPESQKLSAIPKKYEEPRLHSPVHSIGIVSNACTKPVITSPVLKQSLGDTDDVSENNVKSESPHRLKRSDAISDVSHKETVRLTSDTEALKVQEVKEIIPLSPLKDVQVLPKGTLPEGKCYGIDNDARPNSYYTTNITITHTNEELVNNTSADNDLSTSAIPLTSDDGIVGRLHMVPKLSELLRQKFSDAVEKRTPVVKMGFHSDNVIRIESQTESSSAIKDKAVEPANTIKKSNTPPLIGPLKCSNYKKQQGKKPSIKATPMCIGSSNDVIVQGNKRVVETVLTDVVEDTNVEIKQKQHEKDLEDLSNLQHLPDSDVSTNSSSMRVAIDGSAVTDVPRNDMRAKEVQSEQAESDTISNEEKEKSTSSNRQSSAPEGSTSCSSLDANEKHQQPKPNDQSLIEKIGGKLSEGDVLSGKIASTQMTDVLDEFAVEHSLLATSNNSIANDQSQHYAADIEGNISCTSGTKLVPEGNQKAYLQTEDLPLLSNNETLPLHGNEPSTTTDTETVSLPDISVNSLTEAEKESTETNVTASLDSIQVKYSVAAEENASAEAGQLVSVESMEEPSSGSNAKGEPGSPPVLPVTRVRTNSPFKAETDSVANLHSSSPVNNEISVAADSITDHHTSSADNNEVGLEDCVGNRDASSAVNSDICVEIDFAVNLHSRSPINSKSDSLVTPENEAEANEGLLDTTGIENKDTEINSLADVGSSPTDKSEASSRDEIIAVDSTPGLQEHSSTENASSTIDVIINLSEKHEADSSTEILPNFAAEGVANSSNKHEVDTSSADSLAKPEADSPVQLEAATSLKVVKNTCDTSVTNSGVTVMRNSLEEVPQLAKIPEEGTDFSTSSSLKVQPKVKVSAKTTKASIKSTKTTKLNVLEGKSMLEERVVPENFAHDPTLVKQMESGLKSTDCPSGKQSPAAAVGQSSSDSMLTEDIPVDVNTHGSEEHSSQEQQDLKQSVAVELENSPSHVDDVTSSTELETTSVTTHSSTSLVGNTTVNPAVEESSNTDTSDVSSRSAGKGNVALKNAVPINETHTDTSAQATESSDSLTSHSMSQTDGNVDRRTDVTAKVKGSGDQDIIVQDAPEGASRRTRNTFTNSKSLSISTSEDEGSIGNDSLTSETSQIASEMALMRLSSEEDSTRPASPIKPTFSLRRMSFNTRKEAIFQERIKDFSFGKKEESKPWFLQKIEPIKPVFLPKRSIKQQLEFERKVRKLVSDRKCRTYRKAEIVVQLMDLKFEENESIYAATECSTFEQALSYLQQECQLCAGKYPIGEIISMVHCSHKACKECIKAYFTIQIRDRTIMELLCPFCNEPDITDEDVAQDYFNHLDIMLKKLVDADIHELFQRKLRDRVLMKDPNFRWCSQCSSGFITEPNLKRLMCPDCNAITCAKCRRLWEREHEGVSCETFAAWKDANDPEAQTAGLAKLLTENGIDCPRCHFRYALAKGGCMHFKCIQCQHDFCSGCSKPFKMGQKCGISEFCCKLGLHAHHPRNCLFYLRDKEPEDLQRLLQMNDIEYNKDPTPATDKKDSCQVMEQKETTHGMVDDICGKGVQQGYEGLCRVHYVEYLGQLVNKHKIDPIQIFDNDDLELVLRRASIRLPPKKYKEPPIEYRDKLVKLIEEKLPLGELEGS